MSFEKKPLEQGKNEELIPYSKDLENRIESALDEVDNKTLENIKGTKQGVLINNLTLPYSSIWQLVVGRTGATTGMYIIAKNNSADNVTVIAIKEAAGVVISESPKLTVSSEYLVGFSLIKLN